MPQAALVPPFTLAASPHPSVLLLLCLLCVLQLKLRNAARQASKPAQDAAVAGATEQTDRPIDAQHSSSGGSGASEGTNSCSSNQPPQHVQALEPAAAVTQLAVLIVRYCRQLWAAVSGAYGELEAGQVLGYHFSEACQVRLFQQDETAVLVAAI
jgi:hypothetical protein